MDIMVALFWSGKLDGPYFVSLRLDGTYPAPVVNMTAAATFFFQWRFSFEIWLRGMPKSQISEATLIAA